MPDDHPTLPPAEEPVVGTTAAGPTGPEAAPTPGVGPGRAFGDYDLQAEIARGGMGVVYRACQRSLRRPVALKMILAGQLAGPEDVRRFHTEAEAAAGLDHPNVLPIYEVGERDGFHFFSMKLVAGGTLAGRVAEYAGDPAAAARLVATLARAVEYAHRRGVLHRDLKPANVLLGEDGTPYVVDFGLAKRAGADDGLTRTGAILGTPSYMAPEQARGEKALTLAADVYALGAILYELLAGRPPFAGPTALDTVLAVLESEPPHPRSVVPAADPVLSLVALKCLAKDPAGRYPSAVAVADDLERWAAGEPVSVRRPGLGRRVLGWARREPGLACRLAVIGLVAAIVHLKYRLDPAIGPAEQLGVMAVLAGWAVASALCQAVLRREWHAEGVVAAWLAADAAFLTALLALYVPHQTPLVMLYGLLVAASGVWFRVRLVWVSTAAALAGYAVLIGAAAARGAVTAAPHHHVICGIALVAIGTVVAYQVRRTRMLGSRPGATAGGSAAAESKNRRA